MATLTTGRGAGTKPHATRHRFAVGAAVLAVALVGFAGGWVLQAGRGCQGGHCTDGGSRGVPSAPSATTATVYGSSGGPDQAAAVALTSPRIVRTYTPTQLAKAVRAGRTTHHSAKVDLARLAARDPALIASLVHEFGSMLDRPGSRATIGHETDNDVGADPAQYQAAWRVFLRDVMPQVNAGRKNKVITVAITTAIPYLDPARAGGMDVWYVPGADEIGTDAYATRAIRAAQAFAKAKGKPWSLPEYGYSTSNEGTDADFAARIRRDYAIWTSAPAAREVLWFNANHNAFTRGDLPRPQAALLWRTITRTGKP